MTHSAQSIYSTDQRLLICDSGNCRHSFSIPLNAPPAQILSLVCPACNKSVSISRKKRY